MKVSKIIILVLIIAAFGAGIYFKDDAIRLYNSASWRINKQVQDFKKTEIGTLITEAGKEIFTPPPLNIGGGPKGYPTNVVLLKSKVIEETNIQREINGLPVLKENAQLDNAASAKANDMFQNQYFEHTSPAGIDAGKLVQSYGYDYIIAGENLILGNFSSEKEVVSDWMASSGHRANILNNRYAEIGVAVVKGTYKGESVWIGVQEFGLPLSACAEPDASLKAEIESDKMQLNILSSQIDEKRSEINSANPRAAYYSQLVDDYNQSVESYNSLAEAVKILISRFNNQVNIFNQCVAGK